jgi:NADPH:quinone reductase-like Zn-dependent oxidoreductase
MKAMMYEKYGPPDVLHLNEVERPVPGREEVLVKIHAASLNYGDMFLTAGKPLVARLWSGAFVPKHHILGTDIAGVVEAVGENANKFQVGEAVFGDIGDCGFGAFAEYVCVPESVLVRKPANISFKQAAAVPQAAVVALQGLRNKGGIQPGDKVLVNGASGGVGSFAVQIAKALGAEVTGVCSARNLDLVREIGADKVIDYTVKDFTQDEGLYDLIFDMVANRPIAHYTRALSPSGTYVAIAFNPSAMFLGGLLSKQGGKQVTFLSHKPNAIDMALMETLLEDEMVAPVIDRVYSLHELPDAMRYLQNGKRQGKVVIAILEEE